MRIYSLNDTAAVVDPETGKQYNAGKDGALDVPDEFGARLHATHFDGAPAWETDGERSDRLVAEEQERRRDPATLLAEVEAMRESMAAGNLSSSQIRDAAKQAQAEADELAKVADKAEKAEKQIIADKEAAAEKEAEEKAVAEAEERERAEAEAAEQQAALEAAAVGVEVPAGELDERVVWVSEGETEDERKERASAVYQHEKAADPDFEGEHDAELSADLHKAVYGDPAPAIPEGAPTSADKVDDINEYLDALKAGDDPVLYESERARLIDAEDEKRKGLVEGAHAKTGEDLL